MKTKGQLLYESYLSVFGSVFAPTWEGLTEESRTKWEQLAVDYYSALINQRYSFVSEVK